MNYILDTWRVVEWRKVRPEPVLVALEYVETMTLTTGDVVFAHTPTDFQHYVSQDDLPANSDTERRVKCFRQA